MLKVKNIKVETKDQDLQVKSVTCIVANTNEKEGETDQDQDLRTINEIDQALENV